MNNTNTHQVPPDALGAVLYFLNSIHPLSEGALKYLKENVSLTNLSKGEHLVRTGQNCDHLYFVKKGILRGYVKQGVKDITTWITAENELVTSISSYYQQIPSIENIEALEESVLVAIHRNDMQYLYHHYPESNTLVRIILEKYYQDAEERAYICRLTEATSKYHRFINTKSHFLNRIPLKFIASYLGMTLETLSRIRSRMSQQRN